MTSSYIPDLVKSQYPHYRDIIGAQNRLSFPYRFSPYCQQIPRTRSDPTSTRLTFKLNKNNMAVRVVRCSENIFQTIINDVYSHREDTKYAARFIGQNLEAKNHYVVQCETFSDAPKEQDDIRRHIGEALRRAYGAEPQTDTPYVLRRVSKDE
jgi:hypothetical protein